MTVDLDKLRAAKKKFHESFKDYPEMVGVGINITNGTIEVRVNSEDLKKKLPLNVEGFPLNVVVMGPITPR